VSAWATRARVTPVRCIRSTLCVVRRDPLARHASSPAELRDRLAAERRGTPFLLYRDGDDRQVIVELSDDRPRLTIGRSPRNDVALRWDGEVSRLHAQLERIGGDWLVDDNELSRNGTFVNGSRLRTRRVLRTGDVITTGETQLAFFAPAGGSVSATATAAHAVAVPQLTPAQRRVLIALCRPMPVHGVPASNREIADELVVALDTVKGTLSRLFDHFDIGSEVPQNRKRALLARRALQSGVIGPHELDQ
jgi:pSer/pThr/pTyr-binding forkhead associated (FHA) protein